MRYSNGIIDSIIYGNLSNQSSLDTLLQHDFMKARKEKFTFKRLDMNYYFAMCRQTNDYRPFLASGWASLAYSGIGLLYSSAI